MKKLIVYWLSERVGHLEQDEDGSLRFAYASSWLNQPDAVALSRSLPLRTEPFTGPKARPFFAGILPEQGQRTLIAKILGISDSNDFAMLERIGGECAGAVVLLPEGATPISSGETQSRRLNEYQLKQIVDDLPKRPLMAGTQGVRLSLAGVQSKLPIVLQGEDIGLPLGDTPSTHILKPEPNEYPGLALNEWLCMNLAKSMGLNVAHVDYYRVGSKPCLLIQRYDRTTTAQGITTRIHQEDFCQALGLPPERKYQVEGGPTLRDCTELLRNWSTVPALDIPAFLNGLIFNVLVGNADAHGKNFALLYIGRERRLAPLYDLVSTIAWPHLSKHAAMKIGNCESINAFSASDWRTMARTTGLGWPIIRERIEKLCILMSGALEDLIAQATALDDSTASSMNTLLRHRAARLLKSVSG